MKKISASFPRRRRNFLLACLLLASLGMAHDPITIHLAGDSTMAEKKPHRRPETGWGEALQQYFSLEKVRIENHAKGGRSTRTFIEEGLWQQLLERLHEGDYVFIQFGHNDEVPSKVDRYTPPDQYRRNLAGFIADVRAKRATPVLLTPVSRRKFEPSGHLIDSHREYSAIVRRLAAAERVPLIDMDKKSAAILVKHGPEQSRRLFLQLAPGVHPNYPDGIEDNTHFSPAGAAAMAALAVEGIREQKLELAKYLQTPPAPSANSHAAKDSLLGRARIAKLSAGERAVWLRYIARSDSVRRADQEAVAAELRAAGVDTLLPATTGPGFFLNDSMTPQWFATREAGVLAAIVVSYQAPNGGWSKRMQFSHMRRVGEGFTSAGNALWLSTIDNGATTEQLSFVGARANARAEASQRTAFVRGVEYLLSAQFPNGCWPQIFPLAGGYHDAITFNDDATTDVLQLLSAVARGVYPFVAADLRADAAKAVDRGVACMVGTQVVINGQKTVWGAQHDPLTLEPVKARAYEHASLSGRESAAILDFLMRLDAPSPDVIAAVHAGAAWLRTTAIHGFSYQPRGRLIAQEGAAPLWARFYEMGSNRPIFSDRDGIIRYALSEISEERRSGYLWYTDEPATTLRRYERWARKHPLPEAN
jgi:PelA/Pel-15E family pectate lyase